MQQSTYLRLYFEPFTCPQLMRTEFASPCLEQRIVGMRGNDVPPGMLPFRWTTSAQALALLFVKAVEYMHDKIERVPLLEGYSKCPAASLARLLTKRSDGWILDLFGFAANGRTLLSRILLCRNYNKLLPGPFQVFMRNSLLQPSQIELILDNRDITNDIPAVKRLARHLESAWTPNVKHDPSVLSASARPTSGIHPAPEMPVSSDSRKHRSPYLTCIKTQSFAYEAETDACLGRTADLVIQKPGQRHALTATATARQRRRGVA